MDTINGDALHAVAERVGTDYDHMSTVTIHTVTVTLNGQHGGIDIKVQGHNDKGSDLVEFTDTYEVP